MDWSLVWKAVIALAGTAVLLGVVLAVASRRFYVELDPRVKEVLQALPGSNCGACGLPSCEAAAEAVVEGEAPPTICKAGGSDVAEALGKIMGVEVESLISTAEAANPSPPSRLYTKGSTPAGPPRRPWVAEKRVPSDASASRTAPTSAQ